MSQASPKPDAFLAAIFESRMAGSLADLVARQGGIPIAAPSMREVPLQDNPDAIAFAEGLAAGQFEVTIFETGVGIRYLIGVLAPRFPKQEFVDALGKTCVIVRGPKPAAALRELGARIDLQVPEPNTWRETLNLLDARKPVDGLRVAVQEYGKPAEELIAGLQTRGATVTRVPVYRWALPEDIAPLREVLVRIAAKEIDVALFTAAQQVEHVLQVADSMGIEDSVRAAFLDKIVIGSVGPATSDALRRRGLPVDIEPEHPKSGHLVSAVAAQWRGIRKH